MLSRLLGNPVIGKALVKIIKGRAFKPYSLTVEESIEKQKIMLSEKFGRMAETSIGKKLGVQQGIKLDELPLTDYSFYQSFFANPSQDAFMYRIDEYERVRTSGTYGSEKWFMIPHVSFAKFRETGLAIVMATFHDGDKITFDYGDTLYVNVAPKPFLGGHVIANFGRDTQGIINIVPNTNLSFREKEQFFIRNHKNIDGSVMLASSIISDIEGKVDEKISLKGLLTLDSQIADVYKERIEAFIGTPPKTIYGATETLGCTVPSIKHPLGFFFDWRRGIFEFEPVAEAVKEDRTVKQMNEVEEGKIYRLIFTSLEGELTRYVINDCFLCISKGDDVLGTEFPVFKFHSRLDKDISLQNFTRIDEQELISALRSSNVEFVDFTARCEIKDGLQYLAIYVEQIGHMPAEQIEKSLQSYLYKADSDYKAVVDFFGYVPLKVRLLAKGTFSRYMEEKEASWGKVERINMKEGEFENLIRPL